SRGDSESTERFGIGFCTVLNIVKCSQVGEP
ncbi:MAG: hypothetical protein JWN98_348, partial [Abditibacteriota bacterium]|nr:hypothetical protein [Abditibacteriota bacterium]